MTLNGVMALIMAAVVVMDRELYFALWFLLMAALRSRCGHYIFAMCFLSYDRPME